MASPIFKNNIDKKLNSDLCDMSRKVHECGSFIFKVVWDCIDGWHLSYNNKKIIKHRGKKANCLKKCPLCNSELEIINRVEIT